MTIKEAQDQVDKWIKTYGVRYFSELTNMACLTEEVGELARVIARKYGDQSFKEGEKPNLGEEMADVLWVLICLANQTGIDLTEELQKSFDKKTKRDSERHKNNLKLSEERRVKNPIANNIIKFHTSSNTNHYKEYKRASPKQSGVTPQKTAD